MWLSCLLPKRSLTRGSKPRADLRPTSRFRPRLEVLEDRWLPSQIGLTVTSLADSGPDTLRAAILTADMGSPKDRFAIGFAVKGTIALQTPLPDLNNSIAIQGPGAGSLTVERAVGFSFTSAILSVDTGQTASLSGLTIANGNSGGIFNEGTLTVSGCTLSGNAIDGGVGGAIFSAGMLTVNNSTLSGNAANAAGVSGGQGGGIWDVGDLKISGCTFTSNTATFSGGGLDFEGGTLTLTGSTFTTNHAGDGGGIYDYLSFPSTVSGSIFAGNTATLVGGGIDNASGLLTVSRSTLSANSAGSGGGISNDGALIVSSSTLSGNSATGFTIGIFHSVGQGGAIDNVRDTTTVRDSFFSSNSADLGGAIYSAPASFGALVVQGSLFTDNTAGDSGGGIYNVGTATIQECTLSGNSAGSAGGGIFNGASGTLAIKDSVVSGNVAPSGADVYNLGALTLDDSTIGVIGP